MRLVAGIAKLPSHVEHAVAEPPDGGIVVSFPRAGRLCAARIPAGPGDARERFPTEGRPAAEAGVRPVARLGREPQRRPPAGLRQGPAGPTACFADSCGHAFA